VLDGVGGGFVHGGDQRVLGVRVDPEVGQPAAQRRPHREELVRLCAPTTVGARALHHLPPSRAKVVPTDRATGVQSSTRPSG
jgi:hypothetical protein